MSERPELAVSCSQDINQGLSVVIKEPGLYRLHPKAGYPLVFKMAAGDTLTLHVSSFRFKRKSERESVI